MDARHQRQETSSVNASSDRVAYSFIIDQAPQFGHQAWLLASSLRQHCEAHPRDIHVQITSEVSKDIRYAFHAEGYSVHKLKRFGDGRGCNKLAQLPNLIDRPFDRIVLLDTDMIAVSDLRPFLKGACLQGKPVDLSRPSLAALSELFIQAGGDVPRQMDPEADDEPTAFGNANGGFYALPKSLVVPFSAAWRKWALWLVENDAPLRREGRLVNIDQVSAAMAVQLSSIPFEIAPSNINYFIHFGGAHRYYDPSRPIALLHYHHMGMNADGRLEPPIALTSAETDAVNNANTQIDNNSDRNLLSKYIRAKM